MVVDGQATPYLIRHLPVNSFPELPAAIGEQLNERGCLIPQTYEAHEPENVVHASLERQGSSDWAVLCSVKGTVSLLVFLDGSGPVVLASAPETERLQAHDPSGVLGFNWGIDPATPERVHEAQRQGCGRGRCGWSMMRWRILWWSRRPCITTTEIVRGRWWMWGSNGFQCEVGREAGSFERRQAEIETAGS